MKNIPAEILNAVWMAGFTGIAKYDEQKMVLRTAARSSDNMQAFLDTLLKSGIENRNSLYTFLLDYINFPAKYTQTKVLSQIPSVSFLDSYTPIDIASPLLTNREYGLFKETMVSFKCEHSIKYYDKKRKVWRKGKYANLPKDNIAVIPRFKEYLMGLAYGRNNAVCKRFENFPVEELLLHYSRVFNVPLS